MKTTSSNRQFYALQHVPAKKMRKNFTVSANIPIFAASKTYSGMRSRRPNRTAIFVSTPYRNINTTTPCRECGNAPGGSAISTLTTRSVVFFCQKLIVMKTNQTALSGSSSHPKYASTMKSTPSASSSQASWPSSSFLRPSSPRRPALPSLFSSSRLPSP